MTRVLTWKTLSVVVGVPLAAALFLFADGNRDMASALFVVAVVEAVFGAFVVSLASARRKAKGAAYAGSK